MAEGTDEAGEGRLGGVSSSAWLGLGIAAALGLVLAVFRLVLLSPYLGIAASAGLGALTYYALDTYWELRRAERQRGPPRRPLRGRARELSLAPSFEVYDPRRASSAEAEAPPPEGD